MGGGEGMGGLKLGMKKFLSLRSLSNHPIKEYGYDLKKTF